MRVKTLRVLRVSVVNLLSYQNGLPLSDHSAAIGKVQIESLTHGHHNSYANKKSARHSVNVNRPIVAFSLREMSERRRYRVNTD